MDATSPASRHPRVRFPASDGAGAAHRALVVFLLFLVAGCGEGREEGGALGVPVVRDSAGVRVVEHAPGVLSGAPHPAPPGPAAPFAPELDAGPALRIGVVEGEEAYQFTGVRGAARLTDGRIVVLEGPSRTLRFYDAEGEHLRSVGGSGDGPGEFRNPQRLHRLPGDTLLVFDVQQQRLHWFGPDGRFVRDATPTSLGVPGRGIWAGPAEDGGLHLVVSQPAAAGATPSSGRVRGEVELHHVPHGGGVPRHLETFPGSESELRITAAQGEMVAIEVMNHWFLARMELAPGPGGVWHLDGVTPEVVLRSGGQGRGESGLESGLVGGLEEGAPDGVGMEAGGEGPDTGSEAPHGEPGIRLRFLDPPRVLDPAARDTVEARALARAPDDAARERLRAQFAQTEYPLEVPPLASLFSDAEGRIWVAPMELGVGNLPQAMGRALRHWLVLEPDGAAVGWITLPPESRPLWASTEGVLLVRVDELEIPYLEWWPAGPGVPGP